MTPWGLLVQLHGRGIRVGVAPSGRLAIEAPQGVLTIDLRRTLAAERDGLLALLRDPCRAAYRAWKSALGEIAERWGRHAAAVRAARREPPWLDDQVLTIAVQEAIVGAEDGPALAVALKAIEAWRTAWTACLDFPTPAAAAWTPTSDAERTSCALVEESAGFRLPPNPGVHRMFDKGRKLLLTARDHE